MIIEYIMNNVIKSVHEMLLFIALVSMEGLGESVRMRTGTQKPSMLAYTECESKRRPQPIISSVVPLDSCAWAFIIIIFQMR